MMELLIIKFVLAGIVFFAALNLAGFHTWVERKQSALIQDRIGANRADIFGFRLLGTLHGVADVIKMFTKEDIVPTGADKSLHTLAPFFRSSSLWRPLPGSRLETVSSWGTGSSTSKSPRSTRRCYSSLP